MGFDFHFALSFSERNIEKNIAKVYGEKLRSQSHFSFNSEPTV